MDDLDKVLEFVTKGEKLHFKLAEYASDTGKPIECGQQLIKGFTFKKVRLFIEELKEGKING